MNSYNLLSHPNVALREHLELVTKIALETHNSHKIKYEVLDVIKKVCMCHDFAKSTKFFQEYVRGEKVPEHKKTHSLLSAIFTYWVLEDEYKNIGFVIVKAHHGDMKNLDDELLYKENTWFFIEQVESLSENDIAELNYIYRDILDNKKIEDFITYVKDVKNLKKIFNNYYATKNNMDLEDFILSQYIYSLLLTADKNSLILGEAFIPKKPFDSSIPIKYKDLIIENALLKNPRLQESEVFSIRNDIHNEMMDTLSKVDLNKNKIFSINAPAGTAKTMLSFSASFYIANKIYENNNLIRPSIIYALPFMSIIDQNHSVMVDMINSCSDEELNDEDILKFHSVTPIKYNDLRDYDARFCFENWQSRIVSTTFIQLFNTIFKTGDNSIVNRFHKLANSVVIIDEVQVIDEGYFNIIKEVLEFISDKYNIYFILVTATMPMLLDTYELIPNKKKYFNALNRITMLNYTDTPVSIEDFNNIVANDIKNNPDKSFLIILNTIKSSKRVASHLRDTLTDRKVIYLSTEIYPKLRLWLIDKIKKSKEKYVIVSTQLIEAGVDIDMDIVYRDLAPLDCINQSAGRCNRNGIGSSRGIVKLYKIVSDDGKTYCSQVYPRQLISATEYILRGRREIEEKDIFELNEMYFKRIDKIKSNQKSKKLLDFANNMKYEDFRKNFNLIDNDEFIKEDIIVNIDDRVEEILNILKNESEQSSKSNLEIKNLFRELRQYTASVSKVDIDKKLVNYKTIDKYNLKYIDKENYDVNMGVKRISTINF